MHMAENNDIKLAVLEEHIKHIVDQIDELFQHVKIIETTLNDLQRSADRWKMGFVVIAGLGGIIGWMLSSIETITRLFRR